MLLNSDCPQLTLLSRGKVRDLYAIPAEQESPPKNNQLLLLVATDRISAFDCVLANGIPGKGRVLTSLTEFWLKKLEPIVKTHLITTDFDQMPESVRPYQSQLEGRSMLCRRYRILPIEAIVRGYLAGSGWQEYQKTQTICGIPLPAGLTESSELPEPLFTPSTKAEQGEHDENIHPDQVAKLIGEEMAQRVAQTAVRLYTEARNYARSRGIIIADTKFEFGVDDSTGELVLVDEVLTPDSSRFWLQDGYQPGKSQPSLDKQYVRDYLKSIDFQKVHSEANPVKLPEDVVNKTLEKYVDVYQRLTGLDSPL